VRELVILANSRIFYTKIALSIFNNTGSGVESRASDYGLLLKNWGLS